MRLPPAVHVTLARSRLAAALILVLALGTCAVVALLPFDPAMLALGMLVIAVWATDRLYVIALRCGPRATCALWLTGDRMLVVRRGNGTLVAGHVRSATYVGVRITTIVWRPDGARVSRGELILPDMLPADDFRRLRVLLRYGLDDADRDAAADATSP
jgi:hypothetical protein